MIPRSDDPSDKPANEAAYDTGRRSAIEPPRADHGVVGFSAVIFVVSASATVTWRGRMVGMSGMPMPGGRTMSMEITRAPLC
jgi:hypothetical protein